jgi:hypothetical protein
MDALTVSLIVFAVVVGATAFGIVLNRVLPPHHLSKESKEIIHLGIGVIVTLTALVLGLLVASAKSSFDTKSDEIRHSSVRIIMADRLLRQMGERGVEARALLRQWIDNNAVAIWSPEGRRVPVEQGIVEWTKFHDAVRAIVPTDDAQRSLHAKVVDLVDDLAETRWLLTEQAVSSIQTPFLLVVVLWLGIIFASFGLFAPRNWTVYSVIALSALSLSTAVFLILELDQPFSGALRISDAPLQVLLREIHR